jgi:hypothetical protein
VNEKLRPTHFSIGIETMGTRPGSALLSIGGIPFEPQGEPAVKRNIFYEKITLDSCFQAGLTVDAHTIMWWMKQDDEARSELYLKPGVGLSQTLLCLNDWLNCVEPIKAQRRIWAKGPDFDCVLLEHAFNQVSLPVPWSYNAKRDVRTICEAAGVDPNAEQFQVGTKHNALDDAVSQAYAVQEAYRRLESPMQQSDRYYRTGAAAENRGTWV